MKNIYANNNRLNDEIVSAISSIETGKTEGLVQMIKKEPTLILKASPEHKEIGYRPGEKLVTYNGVDDNGKPIQETWGGGVAVLKEDSVILRNPGAIKYPKLHELFDQEVKGTYNNDGIFLVDLFQGEETLHNEYISDTEFVKGAYGIEATAEWQTGFKLQPSYVIEIPLEVGDVDIITKLNLKISLHGGDYVIIDAKKGKVTSVHGCEKSWLAKTYIPIEEHMNKLRK